MGYIAHHAVLVTGWGDPPDVDNLRAAMPERFQELLVGPVNAITNGYWTLAFLPDGSKEGWETSDEADAWMAQFIKVFDQRYEDGSSRYDVAEIRYGGDEPERAWIRDPRKGI